MKHIQTYEEFLLEKKDDTYSSGCAMLYFNNPILKNIHSEIDKKDLYIEKGDRTYGIENEPHVTLLFGIRDNECKEEDIFKAIYKHEIPSVLKMHNISCFKNDKYDVLKFDVKSKVLHDINASLDKFPNDNQFPTYHPHSTICYLKPGMGKKYVKMFKDLTVEVTPTFVVYSRPNGSKRKDKIESSR